MESVHDGGERLIEADFGLSPQVGEVPWLAILPNQSQVYHDRVSSLDSMGWAISRGRWICSALHGSIPSLNSYQWLIYFFGEIASSFTSLKSSLYEFFFNLFSDGRVRTVFISFQNRLGFFDMFYRKAKCCSEAIFVI